MHSHRTIPVIDLFAGPGGLGEGFSAFRPSCATDGSRATSGLQATSAPRIAAESGIHAQPVSHSVPAARGGFRIALSIEKDPHAHQTLRLRSFFRQFSSNAAECDSHPQPFSKSAPGPRVAAAAECDIHPQPNSESAQTGHAGRQFPSGSVPELYYELLRGEFPLAEFPDRLKAASKDWFEAWERAGEEARQFELGAPGHDHQDLSRRIDEAVRTSQGQWVLIGGPPCQAYSVVGRSRNKGKAGYRIEEDHRSSLYREYLRMIGDHWPAVFVMENVKGILSAKLDRSPLKTRNREITDTLARTYPVSSLTATYGQWFNAYRFNARQLSYDSG